MRYSKNWVNFSKSVLKFSSNGRNYEFASKNLENQDITFYYISNKSIGT